MHARALHRPPRRSWSGRRGRQRGQALIYGMFLLTAGLAALFFLFNTGQLTSEKTKLVNTSDAVAYSAGLMHARALNFDAYANRALIANEVIVAQMVSLSSWSQYVSKAAERMVQVHPECADPYGYGAAGGALTKYGPLYAAKCYAVVQYASSYIEEIDDIVVPIAEGFVTAVEVNKAAIRGAQALLHAPAFFSQARGTVMQEVADANYRGDGSVRVEPAGLPSPVSAALTDDWRDGFVQRYSGDERERFAELAKTAAATDDFTKERSWDAKAILPSCNFKRNYEARRGGTELIGLDEWKAEDTESYWHWRRRWFSCRDRETAVGWGEQQAHADDEDESGAHLGGSPGKNRNASAQASSDAWTQYSGIPSFYELKKDLLDASSSDPANDPMLRHSVRVTRERAQTMTSGNRSAIGASERLNDYDAALAGGVMASVSASEVYFERPPEHRDNLWGARSGKPRELASLFNPYWQARLVPSADIAVMQALQGGGLP